MSGSQFFEGTYCLFFPKLGGSTFPQNVVKHCSSNTALCLRRLDSHLLLITVTARFSGSSHDDSGNDNKQIICCEGNAASAESCAL